MNEITNISIADMNEAIAKFHLVKDEASQPKNKQFFFVGTYEGWGHFRNAERSFLDKNYALISRYKLCYDSDWNWKMSVIEKMESLQEHPPIEYIIHHYRKAVRMYCEKSKTVRFYYYDISENDKTITENDPDAEISSVHASKEEAVFHAIYYFIISYQKQNGKKRKKGNGNS